ncbi:GDSL-type esterase/lipase family protein [Leifsonia sp. YAF41]|uniref:GDSL-type esterase/lipase family protein n=1 Tax=Leifsonia sp. YAF41 TaxID=3233086 RepID=UPI003F987AF3
MSATVVFMGDGLIAGGRWDEWLPGYEVTNLGISGATSDDVLSHIDLLVEQNSDAVVLGIGTNDLGWRRSDEHVVRNVETILVTIRRRLPETRILIQSVLPREREFAEVIKSVNRHLWQFAPTTHAQYLDLWPALASEDGELNPAYTDDRLHLTNEGYEAWLAELIPGLETLFEIPPSSSAIPVQHA